MHNANFVANITSFMFTTSHSFLEMIFDFRHLFKPQGIPVAVVNVNNQIEYRPQYSKVTFLFISRLKSC